MSKIRLTLPLSITALCSSLVIFDSQPLQARAIAKVDMLPQATHRGRRSHSPPDVALKWQPKPLVPVACPAGTPVGCKCYKDSYVQDCRGAPKPKKRT